MNVNRLRINRSGPQTSTDFGIWIKKLNEFVDFVKVADRGSVLKSTTDFGFWPL